MNSFCIMKFSLLFLSFFITIASCEATKDNNITCVERGDALKLLYGRDGQQGVPGLKGDRGLKGSAGSSGPKGFIGNRGFPGDPGITGSRGPQGEDGSVGENGIDGDDGMDGYSGEPGFPGRKGEKGEKGSTGRTGEKGEKGTPGKPGDPQIESDLELYVLNNYYVAENGRHDNFYRVKSRELTDGRTDTGGWGSATKKTGNYIEATYVIPVYVTSVTVAGGFIPSWHHDLESGVGYGDLDLEHSSDGTSWVKAASFQTPVEKRMISYDLKQPIVAKYWRLRSSENKWVGTTEFALKPLIAPK